MHALEGDLGLVSLSLLLQLVHGEALDGELVVAGTGSIGFRSGRPVSARCGELEGELALLELFVKPANRFHFDTTVACRGEPLGDVVALVMDGCRLEDDWERFKGSGLRVGADVALPPSLAACADDLRAGYALEVVAARAGVAGATLVDHVAAWIEDGLAELVPAAEPPLELDYWGALEAGREAFRARDYPAAVRAFSRALDCRPGDRVATQNLHTAQRKAEEAR